jgi:hypothetical protein
MHAAVVSPESVCRGGCSFTRRTLGGGGYWTRNLSICGTRRRESRITLIQLECNNTATKQQAAGTGNIANKYDVGLLIQLPQYMYST